MVTQTDKQTAIGVSLSRREARGKVTGAAQYLDDLARPGMLQAALLGSPHAHARIRGIDTAAAKAVPGVKVVLTAAQNDWHRMGVFIGDECVLATGKVRYIGEPVAAIAADTREIAQAALRLIEVDYEPLPAVLDPASALAQGAPTLHEEWAKYSRRIPVGDHPNCISFTEFAEGDLARGWAEADVVVEGVYEFPAQSHVYLEPCGALAEVDDTGKLTVWSATQSVAGSQQAIAQALGLPMSKVRSIVPCVGGGFGGKADHTVQPVTAALAFATGRPVKLVLSRAEDMTIMRTRHAGSIRMKTGATRDGRLTAREAELLFDGGAYCDQSPSVLEISAYHAAGPYRIPHIRCGGQVAYTNRLRAGPFRGFGNIQASFASECQMDELAAALDVDPLELRLKNMLGAGDTWMGGHVVGVGSLGECLQAVCQRANSDRQSDHAPATGKRRGIGIASVMHTCGMYSTSATVRVTGDGSLTLSVGAIDLGQGSDTVLTQILAEALRTPVARINLVTRDSDAVPYDFETAASRVTYMVGNAIVEAARRVREQLFAHASAMLECSVEDLELRNGGSVGVVGVQGAEVSFADISARALFGTGGPISGSYDWIYQGAPYSSDTRQRGFMSPEEKGVFAFGAQAVEVEVDEVTGEVAVLQVWSAHDVGKALNPAAVEGQIEGAVVQGLGYALIEALAFEDGAMVNGTLMDYKVPGAVDAPYGIHSIIIENPEPSGPFGARNVAEHGIISVVPAVINAVANATGVRLRKIPLLPESVLNALQAHGF